MKKIFKLEDLDCSCCAAKMEKGINNIDEVDSAFVNFLGQKLTIEARDDVFDSALKKAIKVIKKIEPDCTVVL